MTGFHIGRHITAVRPSGVGWARCWACGCRVGRRWAHPGSCPTRLGPFAGPIGPGFNGHHPRRAGEMADWSSRWCRNLAKPPPWRGRGRIGEEHRTDDEDDSRDDRHPGGGLRVQPRRAGPAGWRRRGRGVDGAGDGLVGPLGCFGRRRSGRRLRAPVGYTGCEPAVNANRPRAAAGRPRTFTIAQRIVTG